MKCKLFDPNERRLALFPIKYDNINFGSFYPYYEYLYSLIDNLSSKKTGFNEHKNIKNFTYENIVGINNKPYINYILFIKKKTMENRKKIT